MSCSFGPAEMAKAEPSNLDSDRGNYATEASSEAPRAPYSAFWPRAATCVPSPRVSMALFAAQPNTNSEWRCFILLTRSYPAG